MYKIGGFLAHTQPQKSQPYKQTHHHQPTPTTNSYTLIHLYSFKCSISMALKDPKNIFRKKLPKRTTSINIKFPIAIKLKLEFFRKMTAGQNCSLAIQALVNTPTKSATLKVVYPRRFIFLFCLVLSYLIFSFSYPCITGFVMSVWYIK